MMGKLSFIAAHEGEHGVRTMCRVLDVCRSWFYQWRGAAEDRLARQIGEATVVDQIRRVSTPTRVPMGARAFIGPCRTKVLWFPVIVSPSL